MRKKLSCILLSFLLLLIPATALADDYPHEIWSPLDRFAVALEAGNDAEMYEYGLQVITIMENQPDSHLKKEFLAGKYE